MPGNVVADLRAAVPEPVKQRFRRYRHELRKTRDRAEVAAGVFRNPPFTPPGRHDSPIPGDQETEWALRAQPPVTDVEFDQEEQLTLMKELGDLWHGLPDLPQPGWRFRSSWFFPPADATVYFALLRHWHPRRIVEVGSGFSSALALDCSARHDIRIQRTFIEPYPERLMDLLRERDESESTILAQPVQDVPLEVFEQLEANDILFIDTDHFTKSGSEVNWLFFNVLPRVAPGVHIHVHDMFWPFEYPERWLRQRRAYNELYFVRAFLANNDHYRIRLFSSWVWQTHPELFTGVRPGETKFTRVEPGSLWMDKV